MISYRDSMKFHLALAKMNEEDRTSVLNYTIALAEEGIRFEQFLGAIEKKLTNFKEPMSMMSSDSQNLLRAIWDIIKASKPGA